MFVTSQQERWSKKGVSMTVEPAKDRCLIIGSKIIFSSYKFPPIFSCLINNNVNYTSIFSSFSSCYTCNPSLGYYCCYITKTTIFLSFFKLTSSPILPSAQRSVSSQVLHIYFYIVKTFVTN